MGSRAERRRAARDTGANGVAAAGAAALSIQAPESESATYTLSSGVVLRFNSCPPGAVREAIKRVPVPVVPTTYIEAKDREEENPADPNYLIALNNYMVETAEAAQAVAFMLATEVVSVPEGVISVESDEWITLVEATGLDVPHEHPATRLHSWLRLYAIRTEEEQFTAAALSLRKAGLSEEEIAEAIASFRSRALGGTDRDAPAAGRGDSDGDPVHEPDRGDGPGD